MTRKRPLTDEEKRLWEEATKGIKAIKNRRREKQISSPLEGEDKGGGYVPRTRPIKVSPQPNLPPPKKTRMGGKELVVGDYANIDKKNAERFRKGEKPIDATLDLHGMTREKAYRALAHFIEREAARGSRTLLVITGKGSRNTIQTGGEHGILRESLPGWLAAPEFRPRILALEVAKPKHGGEGAYYILLKRNRNTDER